jgi:3D (Asp-Asp-Asp) domain-containing protein
MFEDDREVRRVVVGENVVRAPIDEIIAVGPSVVPAVAVPGLTLPLSVPRTDQAPTASGVPDGLDGPAVRRALTMVATAYDPGPLSTGKRPGDRGYGVTASGMRAGYGVVAVDPRVIPLGTRLYIPGYGYAIAGDTGSAIVGNRIDLGFATYAEAIRFGRQSVAVYVLK